MKNEVFHKEVNTMFESYLTIEDVPQILVKDLAKNEILYNINYNNLLFDTNLNIFKISPKGELLPVNNSNFKAVVIKKK